MVKHAAIIDIRSSVNKDGSILAREVEILLDTGAYACTGPTVLRNAGFTVSGPYVIPNVKIDGLCVYSNKVPAGSQRGYGTPQMAWAYESHTDNIAHALGFDPVEFRLKHLYRTGSETATGEVLKSMALEECLKKAAETLNWNQKPVRHANIKRGKGIACMQKASASPSASTAIVKLSEDGTIRVVTSAAELGQGIQTVLATIVANELKVPYNIIRVVLPDTDSTPYDESSTSSRATFHIGNAVMYAAIDVRNQLLEIAARTLAVKEDMLQINDGCISIKGALERGKYSFSHFISKGHYGKLSSIIGRGSFYSDYVNPFDRETGQSTRPTSFWMYAAQAAEVEIDTETGKIKIMKLAAAHDVGRAISLVGCKQQIEGAVSMGIGQAIFEELIFRNGRVINTNFEDYKIPTIMDMPEIEAIVVEGAYSEHGPHGAKGLGEPALSATAAAIGNAVYDAVGLRIYDLPLNPEKVLMKLKQKEPGYSK
jgi:carbon-monoxide dehydrogenase large subunit